ncbi:MAG: hypothetical protein QG605_2412 [Euryarchaeota archaeon]|jgi:hypothetical protein|nr:hypothetical protein [Euryarchaeota archaeon]
MPVPQGWLLFSQSTFLLFHQPPLMADRLSTAFATGKKSDFSITRTAFISSHKRATGSAPPARAHVPARMDTHQRDAGRSYSDLAISIAVSSLPGAEGPRALPLLVAASTEKSVRKNRSNKTIAQIIRQHVRDVALLEERWRYAHQTSRLNDRQVKPIYSARPAQRIIILI